MEILPKSGPEFEKLQLRLNKWMESFQKWHDHFVWTPNKEPAWSPPQKPLNKSKVALITSAGVHLKSQPAFDVENDYGDWSFRQIPSNSNPKDFLISDSHYDHSEADQDINCVFPISHIWSLKKDGIIGDVADSFFSFMGFIPDPNKLVNETIPIVVKKLKQDGVEIIFMTPGCAICHQSLGLIQNACEQAGMTTISITLKPEVTQFMNIPRAANIRFPYGYPVGSAFQPALQKEILSKTLELVFEIKEPGIVVHLPYRWAGTKQESQIQSADPRTQELINLIDEMLRILKSIETDMLSAQEEERSKEEPSEHKINFYGSQAQRALKLSTLLENDAIDHVHGLRNLSGPIKYLRGK